MGAVRSNLPHPGAVAAERHQPGDDGGFAEADVAHDHHPAVDAGAGALQLSIDLVEHPVPAHEHGLGGDAGHLEQQRLQGDVGGSVGCEAHWKGRHGKSINIHATGESRVWKWMFISHKNLSVTKGEKKTQCCITHRFAVKASVSSTVFSTKGVDFTGSSLELGKKMWLEKLIFLLKSTTVKGPGQTASLCIDRTDGVQHRDTQCVFTC